MSMDFSFSSFHQIHFLVKMISLDIKLDVMVKFVFDEIEYVERIEQVKHLELMITIQQLHQLQSILQNQNYKNKINQIYLFRCDIKRTQ